MILVVLVPSAGDCFRFLGYFTVVMRMMILMIMEVCRLEQAMPM